MTEIELVHAREVLDSRGNPTVEAEVTLVSGAKGPRHCSQRRFHRRARGRGTSRWRQVALPGQGRAQGRGQRKRRDRSGISWTWMPRARAEIDAKMIELDGTENKGKLGANAILAVSMAAARAVADYYDLPLYRYLGGVTANILPCPMMNIINGGAHADSNVDFQEFMVMPVGAPSFAEALRWGAETFHTLKSVLKKQGYNTAVGDEGGFAPSLKSNDEAIEVILEAIKQAGYKPGDQIAIALDPAASEFFDDGKYVFKKSDKSVKSSEQMVKFYADWVRQYPDRVDRRWPGRERLGGLEDADRRAGRQDSTGWRRHLRDQYGAAGARHRQRRGQLDSDQTEPDRHRHRDAGGDRDGAAQRLHGRDFAPLRRNRRHIYRGPGGGHRRRPDQDRLGLAYRPHCQVQPVAAHRRTAGLGREFPRLGALNYNGELMETAGAENNAAQIPDLRGGTVRRAAKQVARKGF